LSDPRRALVTGAASGVGKALSTQLAAERWAVTMVDKDAAVQQAAEAMPGARAMIADLTQPGDVEQLAALIEREPFSCVINCAGIGFRGAAHQLDDERHRGTIQVNVQAMTSLTAAAARSFTSRGGGVIVNVASSAAFQPLPMMAVYAASKAYVLSFSEAVAAEMDGTPVAVITVCPGGIDTSFQERAGVRRVKGEALMTPAFVASRIIRAIDRGRSTTLFVGRRVRVMALIARLVPRRINVELWKRLVERAR
jgi:uncharacterized protein